MAGRWWCGSGCGGCDARSRAARSRRFREQVPGVLDRYQRRTTRLTGQAGAVARRLAGRAGAELLTALGVPLSRHTALRVLLRLPLPEVSAAGARLSLATSMGPA